MYIHVHVSFKIGLQTECLLAMGVWSEPSGISEYITTH
jgi:hypothetical protein